MVWKNHLIFVFFLASFFLLPAVSHSAIMCEDGRMDVVFVLDASGSMDDPCTTTANKITCLKNGTKSIIDSPKIANSRIGIFTFAHSVTKLVDLTAVSGNETILKNYVDSIVLTSDTSLGDALKNGLEYLDANKVPGRKGIVILFTDGRVNYGTLNTPGAVTSYISNNWKDGPIEVYTLGVGTDVDASMLTQIADDTNGASYFASNTCDGTCIANLFLTALNLACDKTAPSILFVPPTDPDDYYANRKWTYINATLNDSETPNNLTGLIDFNRSLVGWWRFNNETGENAMFFHDWSSYGNNGACSGTNCPAYVTGKFGYASKFYGTNDYITIPDSNSLDVTSTFTVEAWIKEGSRTDWHTIVSKGESTSDRYHNYYLEMDVPGNIYFIFGDGVNYREFKTTNALGTGRWRHITAVFYSASDMRVYVDGTLWPGTYTGTATTLTPNTKKLLIGASNTIGEDPMNGVIDEVKIWKRALSPEEIKASFNAGIYGLYYNFTNLVNGRYDYIAYVQDLSGNMNQTEIRTITIDITPPFIGFIPQTPANAIYTKDNNTHINTSVSDNISPNNLTAFIDWNNSLVGWWRFNNEAGESSTLFKDWSNTGNDGTCSAPNCPTATAGKFGNALQFDGINDVVPAGNDISLNINDAITIEAWVKYPQSLTGIRGDIVSKHQSSNTGGYAFAKDANNKIAWWPANGISWNELVSTITISPDIWYHIAVTNDDNYRKIYIDGVERGSGSGVQTIASSVPDLAIGSHAEAGYFFKGRIDEVQIWNRALSPEEIRASYNAGAYRLYHNFTNTPDGIYTYVAYAQDLAGNVNQTEIRTITIDKTPPVIAFEPPTDTNFADRNWTYINTSVSDNISPNNITAFIDFNRTLVGWWRFNNEAGETSTLFRDWSSYQNNGTCSGSACPASITGKFGNATMFDGSNDYIRINSVATELNSVFTVTAWIKTSASMSPGSIVTFHDSGGVNKWRLEVNGNNAGIAPNDATGSRIVTDNRWHHITGVTNGSISYIYVDGVLDLSSVATSTNIIDTDLASIGQEWDPGLVASDFFNGVIDEVSIFNRALSPEEIRASYNAGVYRLYHNFTRIVDGTYTYTAYAQDLTGNVGQTETRTLLIDTVIPPFTNQSISILPLSNDVTLPLGGSGRWIVNVKNLQASDNTIELTLTSNSEKLGNWIWFDGHKYDEKKYKLTITLEPNGERAIAVNLFGGEVMSDKKIKVTAKSISSGSESEAQANVFISFSDDGMNVKTPGINWLSFSLIAAIGALMLGKCNEKPRIS